jgi:hypothetical protein
VASSNYQLIKLPVDTTHACDLTEETPVPSAFPGVPRDLFPISLHPNIKGHDGTTKNPISLLEDTTCVVYTMAQPVPSSFNPFATHPFTSGGSPPQGRGSSQSPTSYSQWSPYTSSDGASQSRSSYGQPIAASPIYKSAPIPIYSPQPQRSPPPSSSPQPIFTPTKKERLTPGLDDLPVMRKQGSSWESKQRSGASK